jgi:hypothetical protein
MPQLSGYTTNLPTNVMLGPAVVFLNAATPWAASQGGITTNIPHEYDNMEFDGKLVPIAGLDRRMGGTPFIEGTFVEMTAARGLELEPGGTSASAGGITTVTPKALGEFLATNDYKTNVRVAIRMGGASAGLFVVEFPFALLLADTFSHDGNNAGSFRLRIEARQSASAANLGVAPYTIKFAADMATIHGT